MTADTITAIKKALEVFGSLKVEFTPESDEGNSIIVPINDYYDGTFFTVIGCGDKQDNLGDYMSLAVNELPDLISEIDRLQRENAALKVDASNHAADAETVRREREVERRRDEAAEAEVKRLSDDLSWYRSGSFAHAVNEHLSDAGISINGDILHDCIQRSTLASTGGEHHAE